jgi:hypothetical protein
MSDTHAVNDFRVSELGFAASELDVFLPDLEPRFVFGSKTTLRYINVSTVTAQVTYGRTHSLGRTVLVKAPRDGDLSLLAMVLIAGSPHVPRSIVIGSALRGALCWQGHLTSR